MYHKYISQSFFSRIIGSALILALAACSGAQPEQVDMPQAGENLTPYPVTATQVTMIDPYPEAQGGQDGTADPLLTRYDWTPQARDQNLTRGEVNIQESGIVPSKEDAGISALYLSGTLPTPCYKLRVVASEPDAQGQILVDVYSVVDPFEICIQVLEPFAAEVPLPAYVQGETTIVVNGESLP